MSLFTMRPLSAPGIILRPGSSGRGWNLPDPGRRREAIPSVRVTGASSVIASRGRGSACLSKRRRTGGPSPFSSTNSLSTSSMVFRTVRKEWKSSSPKTSRRFPIPLAIVNGGGRVILEGVRIFGKPVLKGPPGWISVFPDSGMTTRETDYVNIVLNTNRLAPGIYGEQVFFTSNGGEADVEVFLEVAAETQTRVPRRPSLSRRLRLPLYDESPGRGISPAVKGYRHLGIAFRLFSPGTPGTTDFFRWFNPVKGRSLSIPTDPTGGGKPLPGYLFEGSIGNIATFRLSGNTRAVPLVQSGEGTSISTRRTRAGRGLAKRDIVSTGLRDLSAEQAKKNISFRS